MRPDRAQPAGTVGWVISESEPFVSHFTHLDPAGFDAVQRHAALAEIQEFGNWASARSEQLISREVALRARTDQVDATADDASAQTARARCSADVEQLSKAASMLQWVAREYREIEHEQNLLAADSAAHVELCVTMAAWGRRLAVAGRSR